jgi:hypothetical protein
MNMSTAENAVQWLFLDLNAFFASCEQQENSALRGKPVIVVQTLTASAVAIAASYAAKAFGIETGTLTREARRLCPGVFAVQANHRLYTEYHERVLKAVDTCLPVEKVCSIDEMACRLMGTERQVPVARELALKVKRALREQVGECLTCSVGIAPNVFLAAQPPRPLSPSLPLGFYTQELPRHRIDLGEICRDLLIAAALKGDRMEAAARERLGRACAAKMDYRGKLPLLLCAGRRL